MHTFSLGADINVPVSRNARLYFRPTYSHKSKVYFEDSNREDLIQEAYGLMNASIGSTFYTGKLRYEIGLFGKNIFDKKHIIDAGNSGDNIGFPTFVGGTRRVIGVLFRIGF